MKCLPHADVSSRHHHHSSNSSSSSSNNKDKENWFTINQYANDTIITDSNDRRKCVYTYEDKYSFARILVNDSLIFDSHFESGNLHSAYRIIPANEETSFYKRRHYYDLYMHSDLYTTGSSQWFYFSVSNVKAGQEVTFNIKNFGKTDSLYSDGMRPLLYSSKSEQGWVRCGTNIRYTQSGTPTTNCAGGEDKDANDASNSANPPKKSISNISGQYSVSFTHTFEYSDDLCYFTFCHPYTYTDLQNYLIDAQTDDNKSKRFRRTTLCNTIAGNACDLLTITAPCESIEDLKSRVVVILTARVHPGESNASWIMQGILDFLLGDDIEAEALRRRIVFKIVPMLNPDGVINGNYRTSLAGCDLNRVWDRPDSKKHPTIYYTKELVMRLAKTRTVAMMIDIHGHSRKQGIFFYGCVPDKKIMTNNFMPVFPNIQPSVTRVPSTSTIPSASTLHDYDNNSSLMSASDINEYKDKGKKEYLRDIIAWKVKLFPRLIEAINPLYCFNSCSFKMHKSKLSTLRMVAFTEIGIDCVYTLEASIAGKDPIGHFGVDHLLQAGKDVCIAILAAWPSMSLVPLDGYQCNDNMSIVDSYLDGVNSAAKDLVSDRDGVKSLVDEIGKWRRYYNVNDLGKGASLLSEAGLAELSGLGSLEYNNGDEYNSGSDADGVHHENDNTTQTSLTPLTSPITISTKSVKSDNKDEKGTPKKKKSKSKKGSNIKIEVFYNEIDSSKPAKDTSSSSSSSAAAAAVLEMDTTKNGKETKPLLPLPPKSHHNDTTTEIALSLSRGIKDKVAVVDDNRDGSALPKYTTSSGNDSNSVRFDKKSITLTSKKLNARPKSRSFVEGNDDYIKQHVTLTALDVGDSDKDTITNSSLPEIKPKATMQKLHLNFPVKRSTATLPRRPSSASAGGATKNPKNKINGTILIGDQLDFLTFLQASKIPSPHRQDNGFLKPSVYNAEFLDFSSNGDQKGTGIGFGTPTSMRYTKRI